MLFDVDHVGSNLGPSLDFATNRNVSVPMDCPFSPSALFMMDSQPFRNPEATALDITISQSDQFQSVHHNFQAIPGTELIRRPSPILQIPNATASTPPMNMDLDTFSHLLSNAAISDLTSGFLDYVVRYRFGPATDLRGTTIKPFATSLYTGSSWRIMAWKEGEDVDVMAISKAREDGGPMSGIFHYGIQKYWGQTRRGNKRWNKRVVGWYVHEPKDIEELAAASQQFFMETHVPIASEESFQNGQREDGGRNKGPA